MNEFYAVCANLKDWREIQPLSIALLLYGRTESTALLTHECTGTGKPFHNTIPAPSTYANMVKDLC